MKKQLSLLVLSFFLIFAQLSYAGNETGPLSQVKQDMQAGRYALVIETLGQVIKERNDDYQAWFLFGVAHAHEQQYQQAIEAFRQVIVLRPDLAEPHNNLAAVYNALGDPRAAVRELEAALKKRPDYAVADENIANLYIELALRHYRNSLKQAANPVIEQRYARLLNVRNPIGDRAAIMKQKNAQPKTTVATPAKAANKTLGPNKAASKKPENMATAALLDTPIAAHGSSAVTAKDLNTGMTDVLDALEVWRLAWSAKDLKAYFAAYSPSYQPEAKFSSLKAWKKYKKRVIKNKKFIKVDFKQVDVELQAGSSTAIVMMLQRFRSNTYSGEGFKKLMMKHEDGQWKIVSEASVK